MALWTALGAEPAGFFFISEYRVNGVHSMTSLDVEKAVYPFLGPDRTAEDVLAACTALEKAYQLKGFGAASVHPAGPPDKAGVVQLQVTEGIVARVRVTGARYFSPESVKKAAPALSEGQVLNFNNINQNVVSLNQLQDRTVTPTLRPGAEPGTYDIDIQVKDSSPFHASAELNDDNSPNTRPLRVTASVSDSNLWQSGQGAGFSFEEAPQRRQDSEVFTGYYLERFSGNSRLSMMLQGTKQQSDISTLGGSTVAGPGETLEFRAIVALPNGTDWDTGKEWGDFIQSVSLSVDYKHFKQSVDLAPAASATPDTAAAAGTIVTPITYFPLVAAYSATWTNSGGKGSSTALNASVTFNFRGLGSGPNQFDLNRFGSDGSFVYFRGDISHTHEMSGGWEVFGRVQGQVANQPLVSSEEYSGGGEQTVRGYLESEVVGDNGLFGTLEFRTPSIVAKGERKADLRLFFFADAGELSLIDPLPEQDAQFKLASVGVGARLSLFENLSGMFDVADPLVAQTYTMAHELQTRFSVRLAY